MKSSIASNELLASQESEIEVRVDPDAFSNWFPILREGFLVETQLGRNIREVLCQEIGLSPQYLEARVQTVFLDGKAIDQLESTIITDGCTVALSAAMPGFVGAAFRRGGYYGVMRSGTTHRPGASGGKEERGFFILKLFNLLADELAGHFFERGILMYSQALSAFLRRQQENFWKACREMLVNGQPVHANSLRSGNENKLSHLVLLKVITW